MSTSFYVYETKVEYARTCDICRKGINQGYLHEHSGSTFCTGRCASEVFGVKSLIKMMKDEELFWTDWYYEVEEEE